MLTSVLAQHIHSLSTCSVNCLTEKEKYRRSFFGWWTIQRRFTYLSSHFFFGTVFHSLAIANSFRLTNERRSIESLFSNMSAQKALACGKIQNKCLKITWRFVSCLLLSRHGLIFPGERAWTGWKSKHNSRYGNWNWKCWQNLNTKDRC